MLEKYQLRNGMKVILWPTKKSPVVTVQAWVRTGSADEKEGEEGISHFIEHLLFKGTRKYKVGEIASIIEGAGGELNAYTSFDQTVFHITISKEFTGLAVETLNEMIGYPKFEDKEIDNEREVVIEEIKRSNDSPHRAASRLLFEGVYSRHPYKKPVIGYDENIRKFTREGILNYYNSRYVPKNISLVIVGDFEKEEIQKQIENTFEQIQSYKLRESKRPVEPKSRSPKINISEAPFHETIFHLAWKGPNAKHADTPALDMLALILGQGDSSRLAQRARIQAPVVNYVGSHVYSPQDEGFFAISAGLTQKNLSDFLSIVGEEVLRAQLECVTATELEKALTILEADEIYGVETVDGLARKLGMFELLFNRPDFYKDYLKKLSAVTANDIIRVAKKYLKPENMTIAIQVPSDKESVESLADKFVYDFALAQDALRKVLPEKAKIKKIKNNTPQLVGSDKTSPVSKFKNKQGGLIIISPNAQAPTVSLRLAFRGGQRLENISTQGLSEFLSNTWTAGTNNITEEQLLDKMDRLAMSVRPFAGRNTIGMSLSALKHNLKPALEIFFDVLKNPAFISDAVERERVVMLEGYKQRKDNPAVIAAQDFQKIIFEGHPYALDPSGTEETIKALTKEQIKEHWKQMVTSSNMTLVAVGDVDKEDLSKLIEKEIGEMPQGKKIDDKFAAKEIREDKNHFEFLKKEQSHIIYGVRGFTIYDEEKWALQVMQSVLAGQGGRLFYELRDKASLAYSVSPVHTEGLEVGYFGAYIGCSPEKGKKAIEMIDLEFKKMASERISPQELDRAQRYLVGRHDIGLQKNSSLASAFLFEEVYGMPYENVYKYAEKIKEVTADEVLSLAQKLYSRNKITVAVGPTNPFE